jgi:MFS transporter, DHA1 family, multidrug resistance protein
MRVHFIPQAIRAVSTTPYTAKAPEDWLVPGLVGVFGPPIGLFLFAYTATTTPQTHYLVPTLGIAIFSAGSFVVFQGLICWVTLTYPKYVASLMAGSDFARGMAAAMMVVCSRYMYRDLGVEKGVVIVGGLSCIGIVGMFALWKWGAAMRAKSTFTGD